MKKYLRLCKSTVDQGILIPEDANIQEHIDSPEKDYYLSVFKYNEKHYDIWKEKGTVSGITDVVTDKIYFDFDDVTDNRKAQQDAVKLVNKLVKSMPEDALEIYFSGGKGFGVEFKTTEKLTPEQVKNITFSLAKNLETFDTVIYNASRILRIPGTMHPKTRLYKIPLTKDQLEKMSIDDIKKLAAVIPGAIIRSKAIPLPDDMVELKETKTNPFEGATLETKITDLDTIDCPKWLDKAKFALQEGYFEEGKRHEAFMILGSTYKNQGFDKGMVLNMLKAVADKQGVRNNMRPVSERELTMTVINSIFSPNWNNGQYPLDHPLLQETRAKYGIPWYQDKPQIILDINPRFVEYVNNSDKNRIKTNLPGKIDDTLYLSTGSNVGILGAPGSGKTALALQILKNTSANGVKSVFASLDMTANRAYEKILYSVSGGMGREELYRKFKTGQAADLIKKVEEQFKNVYFFDKSSPSVKDIRDYVVRCQNQTGEKVKLVLIDYFERISSDVSDDTASSKKVAGELQDMVNDLDICLVTLVQPNKMSGDMSKPILSYTNIKGSSFLAQSFRQIIAIYREGFTPLTSNDDRYLTINILKNDLGESGSFDYKWTGKTGTIDQLSYTAEQELKELRKRLSMSHDKDDL